MANDDEIERHRKSVIDLSKPGEALSKDATRATVRNTEWFTQVGPEEWEPKVARMQLHDRLIGQQQEASPNVRYDREAIVLAGPPGAGKSTVLKSILGDSRDNYLVIGGRGPSRGKLALSLLHPPVKRPLRAHPRSCPKCHRGRRLRDSTDGYIGRLTKIFSVLTPMPLEVPKPAELTQPN